MTDLRKASSMFLLFPSPLIHISSKETLNTALEYTQGLPFTAISSPFAGCSLGIPWWRSLLEHTSSIPSILDCGASAALALYALQNGIEGVVCRHFPSSLPPQWKERLFSTRPINLDVKDLM